MASMDGNNEMESKNVCAVNMACKPVVVRGLIYRTVITEGFLQATATNNQLARVRINKIIKYYEDQRKSHLAANRTTVKRLVVPSDEFLGWMKNGCIDNDTYVVLRNCVLKKSYQKKMALRKDLDEAMKMLSSVGAATSRLIVNVDRKEFVLRLSQESKSACQEKVLHSVNPPASKSELVWRCLLRRHRYAKQGVLGLMFGLLAAKVFCAFLLGVCPPKLRALV